MLVLKFFIWATILHGHILQGKYFDEYNFQSLHRNTRSAYPCNSIPSLKKYMYVTSHSACISAAATLNSSSVGVTSVEQAEIVNAHNNYRAAELAADISKMSWDSEVAYVAQKWAENCVFQHDSGYKRRIPGRFSLGQNLAQSSPSRLTWSNVVKLWHDEIQYFTFNGTNDFIKVGHYTQVVWSRSIKIGCGYAKCGTTHLFVCNYGPAGNLNVNIPFKQGKQCGDCPGHCENNLCSCGGLICLNGGTLNLATCTCTCITGYTGSDCSLNCDTKSDGWACLRSYTVSGCSLYTNVPDECPNMCSFCPNAGTAVTGASDGKGNVPFTLTGDGGGTSGCTKYESVHVFVVIFVVTVLLYI